MSAASACWNISHSKCSWYKLANSIDKWDGGISKKDLFIQLSKSVPGQSTQSRMKPLQLHFSPWQDCTILLNRRATVWRKGRGAQVKQHFGEVLKKEQDFAVSGWVRCLPLQGGCRDKAPKLTQLCCLVPCTPSLPGNRAGQRNEGIAGSQEPGPVHGKPRRAKPCQQGLGGRGESHPRAREGFLPEKRALLPALILPTYFSANSGLASGRSVLFDLSEGINLPPPLSFNAGLCCCTPFSLPTPLLP